MTDKRYPAKLLLFGEHILLMGATAIATPLKHFYACWSKGSGVDEDLHRFATSQACANLLKDNQERFVAELHQGLFLNANIPYGYGLGSSGALCAAVYDRYVAEPETSLVTLKAQFASMESFFHGSSSGIDPLTSYLNQSLIIREINEVSLYPIQPDWTESPVVFLLDTHLERHAAAYISWFKAQPAVDLAFRIMLDQEYLPTHEKVVDAWLKQDSTHFWGALTQFSHLQYAYCNALIPRDFQGLWLKSLDNDRFKLKICGAGGGGFILGFSKDQDTIRELSTQFDVILPF